MMRGNATPSQGRAGTMDKSPLPTGGTNRCRDRRRGEDVSLSEGTAATTRDIISAPSSGIGHPGAGDGVRRTGGAIVLAADDIHKSYGTFSVLEGVSLRAHEHNVVSLIGASGSGKSTFLRCMNLLETPNAGRISIEGELIKMRRLRDGTPVPANAAQVNRIRSRVGMVFQNFNLWGHMTVLENVMAGPVRVLGLPRKQAQERAEDLLAKVGMIEKRDRYPAHISGGQQQRCAIARALAMEPKLMLFDEPTSALDPELVGEVLKVIRLLAEEGRTMVIVTHEMRFARDVSTEVLFLHRGRIEEQGPPEQVFGDPRSERCRQFLHSIL